MSTPGAKLRTDIVDVYVFRRPERDVLLDNAPQFLQMLRSGPPLDNTWQPVMGHMEPWETAPQCALRELEEETGLARESDELLGFWALDQVHPFYIAELDSVVMSPRFAAEAAPGWEPRLNAEHSVVRWVTQGTLEESFMWPGQRAALREVVSEILAVSSLCRDRLRVEHRGVKR